MRPENKCGKTGWPNRICAKFSAYFICVDAISKGETSVYRGWTGEEEEGSSELEVHQRYS